MSYTAPQYVDTKEQAILALASTIKGEAVTGGDGSVNKALDILADVLAEQDVQVPQTNAGAILALADYVSGGGGGGGDSDFTTAHVTATGTNFNISNGIFDVCTYVEEGGISATYPKSVGSGHSIEFDVVLYKGAAALMTDPDTITATSGAIQQGGEGVYIITGDCSITTV